MKNNNARDAICNKTRVSSSAGSRNDAFPRTTIGVPRLFQAGLNRGGAGRQAPRIPFTGHGEASMNDETFNMDIRKFLKKVGVTSQREIEMAVHDALQAGKLAGNEKFAVRMTLDVPGLNIHLVIGDEIALE
jgi:hypothetical protein